MEEVVRLKQGYQEMQGSPTSRGCWALWPLVVLQSEPFEEAAARASLGSLGGGHSADAGQVVTHLLEEFHFLVKEVFLQKVKEMRVCVGRTQGSGSGSSPDPRQLLKYLGFCPTHLGVAPAHPGTGRHHHVGFAS